MIKKKGHEFEREQGELCGGVCVEERERRNNDIIIITNMRQEGILFSYLSSPNPLAKKLWMIKTSDIIRSQSNFELTELLVLHTLYKKTFPRQIHKTICN